MYGVYPCPRCGSKMRWPSKKMVIQCDDCGLDEPCERREQVNLDGSRVADLYVAVVVSRAAAVGAGTGPKTAGEAIAMVERTFGEVSGVSVGKEQDDDGDARPRRTGARGARFVPDGEGNW
jgi:hypothetical protein